MDGLEEAWPQGGTMTVPAAPPAMARATEAETLHLGGSTAQLLLDSTATGGALSAHRVRLSEGQLGAGPHRHTDISEVFFVLQGSLDVLAGDTVLVATAGDLVVVPPGNAHAFAASAGCPADVLVMITPGIDRFEFFRALSRALAPGADAAERVKVLHSQSQYDAYPTESPEWSTR